MSSWDLVSPHLESRSRYCFGLDYFHTTGKEGAWIICLSLLGSVTSLTGNDTFTWICPFPQSTSGLGKSRGGFGTQKRRASIVRKFLSTQKWNRITLLVKYISCDVSVYFDHWWRRSVLYEELCVRSWPIGFILLKEWLCLLGKIWLVFWPKSLWSLAS